jgi:hypothetical protein
MRTITYNLQNVDGLCHLVGMIALVVYLPCLLSTTHVLE